MPTHVYANNNEIASKAADGKSIAAFPDVCFTPPAPPAGPLPLPYPNTGEVKNTDKGTTKVFIKDKMVGMEGDSCISKSMGDEAATQSQGKGLITGALQGKCYFAVWSMDVKAEGKGLPRHLDMVTHNHHGSQMGNSLTQPEVDNASMPAVKSANTELTYAKCSYTIYFVDKNYFLISKINSYSTTKKQYMPDLSIIDMQSSKAEEHNITLSEGITLNNFTNRIHINLTHIPNKFEVGDRSILKDTVYRELNIEEGTQNFNQDVSGRSVADSIIAIRFVIKPIVIFMGGAFDYWSGLVRETATSYANANPDKDVVYYTYNGYSDKMGELNLLRINYEDLMGLLREAHRKSKKIILVAHSWGGHAIVHEVIKPLSKSDAGIDIDLLVTLDPVGKEGFSNFSDVSSQISKIILKQKLFPHMHPTEDVLELLSKPISKPTFKPMNVKRWVNVYVEYTNKSYESTSFNNKVAMLGGPWQKVECADVNYPASATCDHASVGTMLGQVAAEFKKF